MLINRAQQYQTLQCTFCVVWQLWTWSTLDGRRVSQLQRASHSKRWRPAPVDVTSSQLHLNTLRPQLLCSFLWRSSEGVRLVSVVLPLSGFSDVIQTLCKEWGGKISHAAVWLMHSSLMHVNMIDYWPMKYRFHSVLSSSLATSGNRVTNQTRRNLKPVFCKALKWLSSMCWRFIQRKTLNTDRVSMVMRDRQTPEVTLFISQLALVLSLSHTSCFLFIILHPSFIPLCLRSRRPSAFTSIFLE